MLGAEGAFSTVRPKHQEDSNIKHCSDFVGVEMVCWWQNEEGFGRICTEREYESWVVQMKT